MPRSTYPKSAGYTAYMRSPEWEERRQERLALDGRRCTGCGSDGSDSRLEVHHLTYERFGCERLEDLMTLCHFCHCREHGNTPTVGVAPVVVPPEEAERFEAISVRDDQLRRGRLHQARLERRRGRKLRKPPPWASNTVGESSAPPNSSSTA